MTKATAVEVGVGGGLEMDGIGDCCVPALLLLAVLLLLVLARKAAQMDSTHSCKKNTNCAFLDVMNISSTWPAREGSALMLSLPPLVSADSCGASCCHRCSSAMI